MRITQTRIAMREAEAGIAARWTGERFEITLSDATLYGEPDPGVSRSVQVGFGLIRTSRIEEEGGLRFARLVQGAGDRSASAVALPGDGPCIGERATVAVTPGAALRPLRGRTKAEGPPGREDRRIESPGRSP